MGVGTKNCIKRGKIRKQSVNGLGVLYLVIFSKKVNKSESKNRRKFAKETMKNKKEQKRNEDREKGKTTAP